MCIFQLYRQLCPKDAPSHAFYPKPSHCPISTCQYSKTPRGHSTLSSTVGHLCKLAGIKRYYTNHSLQATVTSRLYQCVVDEQLVMERTGHRNFEGVRSYKRLTSDEQREALSNLLNRQPAGPSTAITPMQTPWSVPEQRMATISTVSATHTSQLCSLNLPSATFNNSTVNFYQSTSMYSLMLQNYHRHGINFHGYTQPNQQIISTTKN